MLIVASIVASAGTPSAPAAAQTLLVQEQVGVLDAAAVVPPSLIAVGLEACEEPAGTPTNVCAIAEPTSTIVSNAHFKNLTIGVAPAAPFKLTFSGNFVAQRTGEVADVTLFLFGCTSATSPDACVAGLTIVDSSEVTRTTLGANVPVLVGQQVLVTVELSFS